MSQPDLLTQLRAARPTAPVEVREHVRSIAAAATPPRRQLTWRRSLAIGVPVLAALVAAGVLLPRNGQHTVAPITPAVEKVAAGDALTGRPFSPKSATAASSALNAVAVPAPSPGRVQRYSASLELRVPSPEAVSDDTKAAVRIARALGGYVSKLNVDANGKSGYATIVLRIPKQHVQQAVSRLTALGTIIGESVAATDLQTQVDSTTAKIARLNRSLRTWKALPQTAETQKRIDALTAQIQSLERGRSATVTSASYATISVQLTTPTAQSAVHHGHGPLHKLGVIFRWAGIGAVYVLAIGTPLLLLAGLVLLAVRLTRRRRDERLLSRS